MTNPSNQDGFYRPVGDDEPWLLDTIEAYDERTGNWDRGTIVSIGPGLALPGGPSRPARNQVSVAYKIRFDDGDVATLTRSYIRQVKAGGHVEMAQREIRQVVQQVQLRQQQLH